MQFDQVALESKSLFVVSASFTPAQTALSSSAEQSVTVVPPVDLKTSDGVVVIGHPSAGNAVAVAGARVTAVGTIAVRFVNPTTGNLTHASGTFTFLIVRS